MSSRAYKDRYVCYIDLMGISAGVLASNSPRSNFLQRTKAALNESATRNRSQQSQAGSKKIRFDYISDSIFIVSEDSSEDSFAQLLFCCQDVCATFLKHGFFARGGIALGKTYSYERILLGQATVKAVNLEKSVAKYPRVVLDRQARLSVGKSKIFERLLIHSKTEPYWVDTLEFYSSQLSDQRNQSDPHVLSTLESVSSICKFISEGLDKFQEDVKLQSYYQWYANYYSETFEPLVRQYGNKILLPTDLT